MKAQETATEGGWALRVDNLRKAFDGKAVIDDLDWQVPEGRVIGLLGRNGAGKTTLLRCMLGLSPRDGGDVELLGSAMHEPGGRHLHRVGFVPQSFDLFPWMRGRWPSASAHGRRRATSISPASRASTRR